MNYDLLFALFHQPFGGGGGAADAYRLAILDEREVYLVAALDVVGVGVGLQALLIQHLAVAALAAAHEEYEVVWGGKGADVGQAIWYLTADGVVVAKLYIGGDALLDGLYDEAKLVERLGGLRVEVDVACEVDAVYLLDALDDDGRAVGLPHEAEHLGIINKNYLFIKIY